ncbi:MAG TPA: DUF2309 family protein, partial [Polyangiaceae bacterium]|nr:DUF2309 family protein [Polyangiaceae bacterium]
MTARSVARVAAAKEAAAEPPDEPDDGLMEVIEHVAHHLPGQAPIGAFVHHNTLHAFEHLPFHDAVAEAGRLFDAEPYMSQGRFREELDSGRIRVEDIEAALDELAGADAELPGGLTAGDLRRATLLGGIDELDRAAIEWELFEGDLLERLPRRETQRARCRSALERSAHYLQRWLEEEGESRFREELEETTSSDEIADRFGVSADAFERQFDADSVPLVLRRMFAHCRRLARSEEEDPGSFVRHRDALIALGGPDVDEFVHPSLIRWSAAYLDTGLAYWPMPEREIGFYEAVRNLSRHASSLPQAWMAGFRKELRRQARERYSPEAAVRDRLSALGVAADERRAFLEAELLALPGWAGMFRRLETSPELRLRTLPYRLVEFLAVRLTAMVAALEAGIRAARLTHRLAGLRAVAQAQPCHRSELRSAYRLFRLFVAAG